MQKADKLIAFVCSGNTCRSPMAEGIFNRLAEENKLSVRAESFGMATVDGLPASENSVKVCSEMGIDLTDKRSISVGSADLKKYDRFYCMSQSHADILKTYFGIDDKNLNVMGVSDPYGGDEEIYRMCRDEIYNYIEEIIEKYEN